MEFSSTGEMILPMCVALVPGEGQCSRSVNRTSVCRLGFHELSSPFACTPLFLINSYQFYSSIFLVCFYSCLATPKISFVFILKIPLFFLPKTIQWLSISHEIKKKEILNITGACISSALKNHQPLKEL